MSLIRGYGVTLFESYHAKIFEKNLVAILTFPVQTELMSEGIKRKYQHQVNLTQALGKTKHTVALLFQRTNLTVKALIRDFMDIIARKTEPIRPGRKYPREHRTVKKQYYQNYKAIC